MTDNEALSLLKKCETCVRAFLRDPKYDDIDSAEKEDIAQVISIKIFERREEVARIQNFEGWLWKVTKNKALDLLKKNKRTDVVYFSDYAEDDEGFGSTVTPLDPGPGADMIVAQNERVSEVRDALTKLSPGEREAAELVLATGLTLQDAAQSLGLPLHKVRYLVDQARKHLAALLTPE